MSSALSWLLRHRVILRPREVVAGRHVEGYVLSGALQPQGAALLGQAGKARDRQCSGWSLPKAPTAGITSISRKKNEPIFFKLAHNKLWFVCDMGTHLRDIAPRKKWGHLTPPTPSKSRLVVDLRSNQTDTLRIKHEMGYGCFFFAPLDKRETRAMESSQSDKKNKIGKFDHLCLLGTSPLSWS